MGGGQGSEEVPANSANDREWKRSFGWVGRVAREGMGEYNAA